jgi:Rad3-related DNA helicase
MTKIPNPVECGLSEKFTAWRANQEHSINVMITSGKRFVALSAPTGFGKSPAYVAYALLSKKPTCIVTNSKGLQTQLMDDYASSGMVDIRGRGNYPCTLRDDYSCQEGYAARCPYKGTVNCPSSQAEMRAASSSLVVTNYDKWISCSRSMDGWMNHFEQIVLDEGHDAPDALARAMQFVITPDDVEKVLELEYPMSTAEFGSWKGWACNAKLVAEEKMKDWERRLSSDMSPKVSWLKQLLHLRRLVKRLSVIATGRYDNWVVEEVDRGFQFDAVRLGQYAEGVLFVGKKKIVVVSATLRPKTMHMLGLSKDKFDFHEFDSDFDQSRCPIYYIPTMRVDVKAGSLAQLWVRLDQIMSRRADRKGIIDPISFARRDEVLKASRHVGRMMTNQRGENITAVLEAFRAAGPGTVLVSPSVGTGYDFPGRECEYQFICKIPFPDGRAKIQQARQADDKEYGAYNAMQSLVQFFGRGMRSKLDRCEGFLADDHLQWFLPRYGHLAPKSFHSHFRMVYNVPPPPEAL